MCYSCSLFYVEYLYLNTVSSILIKNHRHTYKYIKFIKPSRFCAKIHTNAPIHLTLAVNNSSADPINLSQTSVGYLLIININLTISASPFVNEIIFVQSSLVCWYPEWFPELFISKCKTNDQKAGKFTSSSDIWHSAADEIPGIEMH